MIKGREVSDALFGKPGLWLVIFLAAYNNLINFVPSHIHAQIYIGLNLLVLLVVWILSQRYLNLKPVDIGFTRKNLGQSLLYGIGLTLLVILPFLLLLWLLPRAGLTMKAPQHVKTPLLTLLLGVFFRIPLGTALFEEMLFRGIFFGYLRHRVSPVLTIGITSIFFALWHITPGYKVINYNFRFAPGFTRVGVLLVGLLGAFIAGLAFAWIRHRTRNSAGCILAHTLINSLTLVIITFRWSS